MTEVWLGYTPVADALRNSVIELHGSRPLAETFDRWWPRSFQAQYDAPPAPLDLKQIFSEAQNAATY